MSSTSHRLLFIGSAAVMAGFAVALAACSLDFGQFRDGGAGGAASTGDSTSTTGETVTGAPSSASASGTTSVTDATSSSVSSSVASSAESSAMSSSSTGPGPLDRCGGTDDDFGTFANPGMLNGWSPVGASAMSGAVAIDPPATMGLNVGRLYRDSPVVDPCFGSIAIVHQAANSTQYFGVLDATDGTHYVDVELAGGTVTWNHREGDTNDTGSIPLANVARLGLRIDGAQIVLYAFDGVWHQVGSTARPSWSQVAHRIGFGGFNNQNVGDVHSVFDDFNLPAVMASDLP